MAAKLLPMPIAHRLYNLRIESGFSKEEIARRLGVTKQAVHQWENGFRTPRTANLVALADIYVTSVDYILGRTSTKVPIDYFEQPTTEITGEELLDIQDQKVSCDTCRYHDAAPYYRPCPWCGDSFDNWEAKK